MKILFSALLIFAYGSSFCQDVSKDKTVADNINIRAINYMKAGKYDSSIYYFNAAEHVYFSLNDSLSAIGNQINVGKIYRDLSQYEESLKILYNSASLLEQCCLSANARMVYLFSCYTTIATIHRATRDYDKAEEFYLKILNFKNPSDNLALTIAWTYNNLGNTYLVQEKLKEAEKLFLKSLEHSEKLKNQNLSAIALSNLGIVKTKLEDYKGAETYLISSLKLKNQLGNKKSIATTHNQLGELYIALGQYSKAYEHLQEGLLIIQEIETLDLMVNNREKYIKLLKASGNTSSIPKEYDNYITLKDSLLNKDKNDRIAEMLVKYEAEKKQQQIASLQNEKIIQEADLKLTRFYITTLALIVLLIITVAVFIYLKLQQQKKYSHKIETLRIEAQHRIKNNLQILASLLSLQTRSLDDQKAIAAIKSSENRINTMSLIHQKLNSHQNKTKLNLREYITEIIMSLAYSYGYEHLSDKIEIEIENIELDVDVVIPIGLIVNELVSNSFKHAFPNNAAPALMVNLIITPGNLELVVADNGSIVSHEIIGNKNSLGNDIVDMLVTQLSGKINKNTDDGYQVIIEIPLKSSYGKFKDSYSRRPASYSQRPVVQA